MTQRPLLSLLLVGALAALGAVDVRAAAAETDAQIKALGQRYNQVEAQLARALHYLKKETAGDGATTTEQAWFNGAGELLKVSVERSDTAASRELTEWVARSFENPHAGLFVLNRKETSLPNGDGGGTQVEESRKYYGSSPAGDGIGVLIRELRKSAKFRAGETLDTVHTPNTVVDLARQPQLDVSSDAGARAVRDIFNKPGEIAAALQKAGPPHADPAASAQGDRARFRVINGSASPDGRYAIAIGFAQPVDWEKDYRDTYFEEEHVYTAEGARGLRNYVVDLVTGRVLGETGCAFFGTRQSYNHRGCSIDWSPDSTWFVELTREKWNYVACHAGHIVLAAGSPKLLGCPDVGKHAEKAAAAFLAARKRRVRGSIAITAVSVNNDGVIELTLLGEESSGERKGEIDFSTDQRLRLRPGPGGALSLETLSVRPTPKD